MFRKENDDQEKNIVLVKDTKEYQQKAKTKPKKKDSKQKKNKKTKTKTTKMEKAKAKEKAAKEKDKKKKKKTKISKQQTPQTKQDTAELPTGPVKKPKQKKKKSKEIPPEMPAAAVVATPKRPKEMKKKKSKVSVGPATIPSSVPSKEKSAGNTPRIHKKKKAQKSSDVTPETAKSFQHKDLMALKMAHKKQPIEKGQLVKVNKPRDEPSGILSQSNRSDKLATNSPNGAPPAPKKLVKKSAKETPKQEKSTPSGTTTVSLSTIASTTEATSGATGATSEASLATSGVKSSYAELTTKPSTTTATSKRSEKDLVPTTPPSATVTAKSTEATATPSTTTAALSTTTATRSSTTTAATTVTSMTKTGKSTEKTTATTAGLNSGRSPKRRRESSAKKTSAKDGGAKLVSDGSQPGVVAQKASVKVPKAEKSPKSPSVKKESLKKGSSPRPKGSYTVPAASPSDKKKLVQESPKKESSPGPKGLSELPKITSKSPSVKKKPVLKSPKKAPSLRGPNITAVNPPAASQLDTFSELGLSSGEMARSTSAEVKDNKEKNRQKEIPKVKKMPENANKSAERPNESDIFLSPSTLRSGMGVLSVPQTKPLSKDTCEKTQDDASKRAKENKNQKDVEVQMNIDVILRLGAVLERHEPGNQRRRLAFDWISDTRSNNRKSARELAEKLHYSVGDVQVDKGLVYDALVTLMYERNIEPEELTNLVNEIKASNEPYCVNMVANLLRTRTKHYGKQK